MNASIGRLFAVFVVLFGVLVAFTSRWTVFEAAALRDNSLNRRPLLEEARVKRGRILAADGTVLARSVHASKTTYTRLYPAGGLFGHAIGYSFTQLGRVGLEQSRNGPLTGQKAEFSSILDELTGKRPSGEEVQTTLDPRAQRVALAQLAGRKGAVVALEPATGRIRVMASVPQFDPNDIGSPRRFRALNRDAAAPLLNRATQANYPPGSTFKVVTAAAAIDSGRYTPQSTIDGKDGVRISGVPLHNDFNQSFGPIDLTTALTQSVNTVFGQLAEKLGKATMGDYMKRFGFYAKPPLDYPANQRSASGEYYRGRLLGPTSDRIDVGRMGIGQDKLQVTPLQMAEVAATVANGGVRMKPRLTRRVVDSDGRTVLDVPPSPATRVMSQQSAHEVGQMMSQVVKEGTGTAAALTGIDVAGKTGTADVTGGTAGQGGINQVWFIAYAPVDHPRIAIAATVERSPGFGGTVAAPIAKQVLESLLR